MCGSSLFRIGNMGESVVFVHEGSKMPAGDSPTAERTTLEEAGIRDGSSVFVFDKVRRRVLLTRGRPG